MLKLVTIDFRIGFLPLVMEPTKGLKYHSYSKLEPIIIIFKGSCVNLMKTKESSHI